MKCHDLGNLSVTKQNKLPCFIDRRVWPMSLAQVWTHFKIGEIQHMNYPIFEEWPHSQLIFLPKPSFFVIYLNLPWQKSHKMWYLPHPKSKTYKINFIKSCSSKSFKTTKSTSQFFILEMNGRPSNVTMFSTDFSFQNLFFVLYLNFWI